MGGSRAGTAVSWGSLLFSPPLPGLSSTAVSAVAPQPDIWGSGLLSGLVMESSSEGQRGDLRAEEGGQGPPCKALSCTPQW